MINQVRILKTKDFHRWAEKINLQDDNLRQTIEQIENFIQNNTIIEVR
jgi:hypothetical protein